MGKDPDAYRTISEVAEALDIQPHVLRFWETKFPQVKPLKRGGGRRFYRRTDIDLLRTIRRLLYEEGYTIRGVQRLFKSGSSTIPRPDPAATPHADGDDEPNSIPSKAIVFAPAADRRVLIAQLAAEIEACQAILRNALRSSPDEERPGQAVIQPLPAAAEPDAPASGAPLP